MRLKIVVFAAVAACAALLNGVVSAQTAPGSAPAAAAPPGDAKHGFAVWQAEGCYECHGFQGQGNGRRGVGGGGGDVGPSIAPKPPAYALFIKQLRTPREVMPPYSANILSDRDASDIYAYLSSIPATKDPATIPLLNAVGTTPSAK